MNTELIYVLARNVSQFATAVNIILLLMTTAYDRLATLWWSMVMWAALVKSRHHTGAKTDPDHIHVSETFFDTTRITSVAIAFGCCMSRDVATTGN